MKNLDYSKCFENNKTELIAPVRIKSEENVLFSQDLIGNRKFQVALRIKPRCVIKSGGYILLDYGKELYGGIRPVCGEILDKEGNFVLAKLHLTFGESLTETCSELGEKNSGNYHSMRDFTVNMTTNSYEVFGTTGFRFVKIENVGENDITLAAVPAINCYFGAERKGEFECDDKVVNDIFATAAHTLELCIQNGYIWDGAKRDRCVWVGDMHPEVLAAFMIYGKIDEVKNSLEFALESTPDGEWLNMIPAYSLWYIMLVYEYDRSSGEKEFGKSVKHYIEIILKRFDNSLSEDGTYSVSFGKNLKFYSKNDTFFDWPTNFTDDSEYGVRALMIIAFDYAEKMYADDEKLIALCESLKSRVLKKNDFESEYKQVVAMRVIAGVENEKTAAETLVKGDAAGLGTFMSYYILKAIADLGMYDKAFDIMKQYYGGMLSMGATTFWEDFDIKWMDGSARIDEFPKKGQKDIHGDFGKYCYKGFRHSLCHGWSVGVIPYLFEYVLGVQPSDDGFRKVYIEPHLGTLCYAKGKIPTPYGVIDIEHRKDASGNITTRCSAPRGIKILSDSQEKNDAK